MVPIYVYQARYICGPCALDICQSKSEDRTTDPTIPVPDFGDSWDWPHGSSLYEVDRPDCNRCASLFATVP